MLGPFTQAVPRAQAAPAPNDLDAFMQQVLARRLPGWVGREVEVLLESAGPTGATGRMAGQAPDVDGEVRIDVGALPEARAGDFVLARLTGVDGYDFHGEAIRLVHRPARPAPELIQLTVR